MTPKEKATEIVFKMFAEWMQIPYEAVSYHLRIPAYTLGLEWNMTKHCALIAVDEIIESSPLYPNEAPEYLQPEDWFSEANISADQYWVKVKKEIEAL